MCSEELLFPRATARDTLREVARLMVSEKSSEVFVIDDEGKPIGVVRYIDVVRSVANGSHPERTSVQEIMLRPPPTVSENATLEEVSEVLKSTEVRRILVVRGGDITGVIEAGELFDLVSSPLEKVEVYKAMSVKARLRMVELLSLRAMSVDELAEELGIRPITVRHHIGVLRRNGIIEELQEGRFGKVGRPLSLFRATRSVLSRSALPSSVAPSG
jgi:CBS domain-containing protein